MKVVKRGRLMLVVVGTMAVFGSPAFAQTTPAAAPTAATVKRGQQVYTAQKCATCHQIAGKGNKANPLDKIGAKLSTADIKAWIVDPVAMAKKANSTKKPPMAAKYAKLPAKDIDSLVAYMASLK